MEKGKAYRRAQAARLKRNRRHYYCGLTDAREIGRVLHTATLCSCWMCGNARRHAGERTIKERAFYQKRLQSEE